MNTTAGPMTTTARRIAATVATIADAITNGIPVVDDHTHKPLMFAGQQVMRPGMPIIGMDCPTVDALAELLLLGGHTQAARMVVAEHTSDDDEVAHWHIVDKDADRVARLAYAARYLSTVFDAPAL